MSPRSSSAAETIDPVLLAIQRAPIEPWTEEEAHAVAVAQAERSATVDGAELGRRIRAHHGVSAADWHDDDA